MPGETVDTSFTSIVFRNGFELEATVRFGYVFLLHRRKPFDSDASYHPTEQRVGIRKDRKGWTVYVLTRLKNHMCAVFIFSLICDPNHGYNSPSWGWKDENVFLPILSRRLLLRPPITRTPSALYYLRAHIRHTKNIRSYIYEVTFLKAISLRVLMMPLKPPSTSTLKSETK